MDIIEDIKTNHAKLSPVSQSFLEYVETTPELKRAIHHHLSDVLAPQPQFTWPLFVDAAMLAKIKEAAIAAPELVKTIPQRIFDNDPKKISAYYGLGSTHLAHLILAEPNGMDTAHCRSDYVYDGAGFHCLETNLTAAIGGTELGCWLNVFRQHPPIRAFLDREGIRVDSPDPARVLLRHTIRDSMEKSVADNGTLNIALVLDSKLHMEEDEEKEFCDYYDHIYQEVLKELDTGLEGRMVLGRYPDGFTKNGMRLYSGPIQVHSVIEATLGYTPEPVMTLFKCGVITLYNGPMQKILCDKRNFSLLSANQDSDVFDARERELIRRLIPWSRDIRPGDVSYRGRRVSLVDLLMNQREDLVIKRASGGEGRQVIIGKLASPKVWEKWVATAMTEGGAGCRESWMVQEFIEAQQYMFQCDEEEVHSRDVVWGLFCFGREYGGGFVWILDPAGRKGHPEVIAESMVLEV